MAINLGMGAPSINLQVRQQRPLAVSVGSGPAITLQFASSQGPGGPPGVGSAQIVTSLVNGEAFTIQAGMPVRISGGGDFRLALGSGHATQAHGVALEQIASGAAGQIIVIGQVQRDDWTPVVGTTSLVCPAYYYLSTEVAGALTEICPSASGLISQRLGFALDPQTLAVLLGSAYGL
jgi:hypothetical protein